MSAKMMRSAFPVVAVLALAAALALPASQAAPADAGYVFNEYMGSWRRAPATFEDPKLGFIRTVNTSDVPGLEAIATSLLFLTMKPCTAMAPNYHPNADEFLYALKGNGGVRSVVWNGTLYSSVLKEGDLHVIPQGLMHLGTNPSCEDVEYLVLYNNARPLKVMSIPSLLAMPQADGYMQEGGFEAFIAANPNPPSAPIYPLAGNCSQLCADQAAASAAPGGTSSADSYNRFTASLPGAPYGARDGHGSHQVITAAELPALGDIPGGASFSYTTVKNCSFPAPHYMPHANKLTVPVKGAVNVSVLVNGTELFSQELGSTGDFFVLPKADLFSLSNELCRDAHIVAYWDAPDAAKTYPLAELQLLPEEQLAGAFGVEGSPPVEAPTPGAFWPFAQPGCAERCRRLDGE